MKRTIVLTLACATLLLATVGATLLASSYARAGSDTSSPRIQMLSGTFADQNIPGDNQTKVTLLSIPFRVSMKSKLEATSLVNAIGPNGNSSYVVCELDVDDVSFFSVQTWLPNYESDSASVGVTSTTTGITPGNHTFELKCTGYNANGQSIPMHSLGTSVIVTG